MYSRDECRYDSMAEKIEEQCKCKPRFIDQDLCEGGDCNATCRGAGLACAAKMGTAVEYTECPKPCNDIIYGHSISFSGML